MKSWRLGMITHSFRVHLHCFCQVLGAPQAHGHFKLKVHWMFVDPDRWCEFGMQFCIRDSFRRQLLGGMIFSSCKVFVALWLSSLQSPGGAGLASSGSLLLWECGPLGSLIGFSLVRSGTLWDHQTQSLSLPGWQMFAGKNSSRRWLTSLISLRFCLVIHYKLAISFQEDVFRKMLIRNLTSKDLCTKILIGKLVIRCKN